jgi:hypothetical protein
MLTAGSSDYLETVPLEFDIDPINLNWALIIQDMKENGLSGSKQALSIGSQWSTLQRWWQGSEPSFRYGHALLILHSKVCGTHLTRQRLLESVER